MPRTYFDAVLDYNLHPRVNGTPEEVLKWLEDNETRGSDVVCDGRTLRMMTVPEYREMHASRA